MSRKLEETLPRDWASTCSILLKAQKGLGSQRLPPDLPSVQNSKRHWKWQKIWPNQTNPPPCYHHHHHQQQQQQQQKSIKKPDNPISDWANKWRENFKMKRCKWPINMINLSSSYPPGEQKLKLHFHLPPVTVAINYTYRQGCGKQGTFLYWWWECRLN